MSCYIHCPLYPLHHTSPYLPTSPTPFPTPPPLIPSPPLPSPCGNVDPFMFATIPDLSPLCFVLSLPWFLLLDWAQDEVLRLAKTHRYAGSPACRCLSVTGRSTAYSWGSLKLPSRMFNRHLIGILCLSDLAFCQILLT